MTVAFAISAVETEVVEANQYEGSPFMNGGLFTFTRAQLPEFLNKLAAWSADHPLASEEFRAAIRLQERLGTWIGRGIAVADEKQSLSLTPEPEAPSPAPVKVKRSKSDRPAPALVSDETAE